jgi:hypothetical protein
MAGSMKYDRDALHNDADPTIDGAYPNPVVQTDLVDHRDKTTGESRGDAILTDPWHDTALAAKAGRKRAKRTKND